jgi:membrane-associated phospholipid phosphatase
MAHIVFVRVSIAAALAAFAATVSAQGTRDHASDSLPIVHGDSSRTSDSFCLISTRDAWILSGAVVATASLAPFDHGIQRAFRAEDMRNNGSLRRGASALAFTGGPGPFVAGGLLYLAGEVAESPRVATLGVTLTEGVILAAALNGLMKGVTGRALPNATSAEPGEFSFGRGFHEGNGSFVSFPSGHTAASFAAAAVFANEVSTWNPSAGKVVTPAVYSLATLVAVSRLYENVHWASDLPLGAAIGVWSGRTAVVWQHKHPDNWLLRQLIHLQVVPTSRGLTMNATF